MLVPSPPELKPEGGGVEESLRPSTQWERARALYDTATVLLAYRGGKGQKLATVLLGTRSDSGACVCLCTEPREGNR